MTTTRRVHLATWALGLASASMPAHARPRPRYGSTLRFELPLATERLDPHDPEDLTAALFGPSTFETLFSRSARGTIYPTLAESEPVVVGGRTTIRVRPGLTSARGAALSTETIAASLVRASKTRPHLASLGRVRAAKDGTLSFPTSDARELTELLATSGAALVPPRFDPRAPDATGAFRVTRLGPSLRLARNPSAPRGGAYLDGIEIVSAAHSENLGSFEAGTSDLGWLGAGLHVPRKDALPFEFDPLGLVVVIPGARQKKFFTEGVAHAALERVPRVRLGSLGIDVKARDESRRFVPPRLTLLAPGQCPSLVEAARLVADSWSGGGARPAVEEVDRAALDEAIASGDFDLRVGFLQTSDLRPSDVHLALLALDGASLPERFTPESPDRLARRLRLGVLGEFRPHGFVSPEVRGFPRRGRVDFAELERSARK